MIPEEDRGPAWMRDYGYTDFSQIEADIQAMEQFATKLQANVTDDYAPHLSQVSSAMTTRLPDPPGEFIELLTFLFKHNEALDVSHQNIYNYAGGTQGFAKAAEEVSKKYEGSDAFAHARVKDVDSELDRFGVPSTNGNVAFDQTGGDV